MDTDNILQTTRSALGLADNTTDFNSEILMHINSALSILNQNGIGVKGLQVNDGSTWGDFKDPLQIRGNWMFNTVPTFVFLKTKILFDPPPPSSVAFHKAEVDELLWRLRLEYEEDDYATQT